MSSELEEVGGLPAPQTLWPDPTPEMLESPIFEAIWQCVKTWDVNVRDVYRGYCGATGNHVRAILDAVAPFVSPSRPWLRAEEVRESGSYWWVNDASYATPVTVYVMKSGTDGSCFASAGQLGWWKAMQLTGLGGLWQRIPEPELPEGETK